MTYFIPLRLRRALIVFAGVISACLFDLGIKDQGRDPVIILDHSEIGYIAGVGFLGLFVLMAIAAMLERYVRPLSNVGAISTGFCGYALISFLMP